MSPPAGWRGRLACLALWLAALPAPGGAVLARVGFLATSALANFSLGAELQDAEDGFLRLLRSARRGGGGPAAEATLEDPRGDRKGFLSREMLRSIGIDAEDEAYLDEYAFHCRKNSGFKGQISLCQALLILSLCCLVAGSLAHLQLKHPGSKAEKALSDGLVGPTMRNLLLACATLGGVVGYFGRVISDIMVVVGFAYCGHGVLLIVSILILAGAQVFTAYEYATTKVDLDEGEADDERSGSVRRGRNLSEVEGGGGGQTTRFMLSLFQMRIFIDAHKSWQRGEVVDSLARQKFIDAVVDSGPFAVFAVYVIFYFDIRYDTWLTLSVFGSILGLAYHVAAWMVLTLEKQLEELEVPPSEYSVKWNHHVLWLSYFTVDFSLRLVTLGLFLSIEKIHPWNQLIFLVLLLTYLVGVSSNLRHYERQQARTVDYFRIGDDEVVSVRREAIRAHMGVVLVLTFLVNALPADLRPLSHDSEENKKNLALEPEVRDRIMWTIIPLRAAEYVLLGGVSMFFEFNHWQCASIVTMFVVMHVLLYLVLQIPKPLPEEWAERRLPSVVKKNKAASSNDGSPLASDSLEADADGGERPDQASEATTTISYLGSRKLQKPRRL